VLRLALAAAILAVLALMSPPSFADWLVELDGGDAMKVDSYRENGDRMHLMRGGSVLTVPRSRVRALTEISRNGASGVRRSPAAPAPSAPAE
jgi:hypothetical protein